jgi:hypothetical protein
VSRNFTVLSILAVLLIIVAVLGGLIWSNMRFVQRHPGEKDFLVPWLASRTFLQYGISPYDSSAAERAQIIYYGRLSHSGEDPLYLGLPFPVLLVYMPLGLVSDYALARGIWMTILELALAVSALIAVRLTSWKANRFLLGLTTLFSVLGVAGAWMVVNGSGTALVVLAMGGILVALDHHQDELAGVLFVLLLVKPEIGGLFILLLLWWAIDQRRGRILGGFLITLALFLVASFLLLPSWVVPFLRGALLHARYNPGITPGGILASWWPVVGAKIGWLFTALGIVLLFLEWRAVRGKPFRHLLWTVSLTLTVAPLIGIPILPADLVILFLPLVLVLSIFLERWSFLGRLGAGGVLQGVMFLGMWLIAFLLPATILLDVLILWLPLLLLLGLYWLRWWAIRPPRTWFESPIDSGG